MNNSQERKLSRLEELEMNEDFQRLPEDKKVILIAGEKILEMDQYFKNLLSQFANMPNMGIASKQSEIANDVMKLIEEKINSSIALKKEDVLELIDQRYNEELLSLENKYQFATQQAIKNMDESFSEALQKVESLSQFQIHAREEIRKNQDKIYILEEEIQREKEKNEHLKKIVDESVEKQYSYNDDSLLLNNYEFLGRQFNSFEDLKDFVRDEARTIAENEIEKYLHEKDMFSDDISDELKDSLYDKKITNEEILKIYDTQISNGSKLDNLEKLIDKQHEEMKLLSEERKNMIMKVADYVRNNKLASSEEVINYLESNNQDIDQINIFENELSSEPNKLLSDDEIEFLIKNEAIELVKDRLNELSNKSDEEVNQIILNEFERKQNDEFDNNIFDNLKELSEDGEKKLNDLHKVNEKIVELQKQLRTQIEENENLRNDLFDEISKNATELFNNDNINIDYTNNLSILIDEDDMSKHNYYDGKNPIPGTKITRINNYRINNDLDSTSYDETQEIIRNEVENLVKNSPIVEESNNDWQENNQKILDLENLVVKQEEELNRLRSASYREEEKRVNEYVTTHVSYEENDKQKEFMKSLEQTLSQLKELSSIQAQTVADLEKQSRKLEEIEQKVKNEEQNKFVTHDNLDQIISEKYKSQRADEMYYAEIKKVEEERKRIEEALELERLRLMTEITSGKDKLNNMTNNQVQPEVKPEVVETKKEEVKNEVVILETPKKKRKQQIFYEVKVHNRPKLTRADLEK